MSLSRGSSEPTPPIRVPPSQCMNASKLFLQESADLMRATSGHAASCSSSDKFRDQEIRTMTSPTETSAACFKPLPSLPPDLGSRLQTLGLEVVTQCRQSTLWTQRSPGELDISLEPSECGDLKLGANRSSSCESSVCQEGHGFPSESSVGSLADLNNSEELWPCRASRAQLPPTSIDDAVDYDASCHLVPLMEPQKNDKKRIRRSLSRWYNGKSKSFTSLVDVSSLNSVQGLRKPERMQQKRRMAQSQAGRACLVEDIMGESAHFSRHGLEPKLKCFDRTFSLDTFAYLTNGYVKTINEEAPLHGICSAGEC
mmetsp:Transcript_35573/g.68199  ORF Transcript_35573/g.68199 Transcript_35573/m.68199 type:complete len:313 (+) Transcript_35573:549-1487(+)